MTRLPAPEPPALAQAVAARFGELPQVTAVGLAGSRTTAGGDERSDLDFYVYATEEIPVATRAALAAAFAPDPALDNRFWEPGDDWIDTATGVAVDVMYRSPAWIEEQLDRVLVAHEASVGYSTCFWYNVLTSLPLFDPTG